MNRLTYALFSMVGLALVACNLNSSDEGKSEVNEFSDLPNCSQNGSTSGVSPVGETVYVEEDEYSYRCTESGWVVSAVKEYEALPVCPGARNRNLGVKVFVQANSLYYLCGTAGWAEATEDSDESAAEAVLEDAVLTGNAFAAGPFVAGSELLLQGVSADSRTKKLSLQEKAAEGVVTSANGDFLIANVNSYSYYALLTVKGVFKDILTGETSEDSLELKGFVDLTAIPLKVDVRTHILQGRISFLINSGYSFVGAVEQATKELDEVFGFGSSVDEASAAVAISILLRANLDEKEFADAINALTEDFAEDGTWDNSDDKTRIADFAFNLENLKLKDEDSGEILLKESDFRRNLEAFGIEDVAQFESYITKFWVASYGLGGCGSARQGAVVKNANAESDSAEAYFACDNSAWRVATDFERDTVGLGNAEDGTLAEGSVNSDKIYAYDTTGLGTGEPARWKEADSITVVIGKSCTDAEDVVNTVEKTEDENNDPVYYGCVERQWQPASETAFEIGYMCNANAKNVVEKYKHEKTDAYARCREIAEGVFTWYAATETDYDLRDEVCIVDELVVAKKVSYVCEDADAISWRKATSLEEDLGPCSKSTIGATGSIDSDNYTCGCIDYTDPLNPTILTDAETCGYNPIAWQKN